jgi:RNA polymerase sigma factor (sigma-70 family)
MAARIPDIPAPTLARACAGDVAGVDEVLGAIQPGIYNLAVRMLGHREDARDATQEIMLKVVTHLSGFRGEAAFSTWVYSVARHHLLTASTRARETPEVSLDALKEKLGEGLRLGAGQAEAPSLSPEDKLAARQAGLACTQHMLMTMDRGHRLAFILDVAFGLDSTQAAQVMELTPAAYRKRLSRVRTQLQAFAGGTCGLSDPDADCRCERLLPAIRLQQPTPQRMHPMHADEREMAGAAFDRVIALADMAAVFRGHPDYQAPETLVPAIRAVLRMQGLWSDPPPLLQ